MTNDDASAARIIDEALGFLYPAALRTAAAVGVADHLTDGPRTPSDLAKATGTDPRSLHRVLRLLATRGLFEEDAEGRFHLTETGSALRSDAPVSVRSAVLMITDRTFWLPAGEMTRCLEEGTSAFEGIFGVPFFDYFTGNAETAAIFHDGMASMSDAENQPIADAYSFPPSATVVDVGGGHGGLLQSALRNTPGLQGILYDRPHVLAGHRLDTPDLAGRWTLAEGDFFTSAPPGDIYLLKRILHDWDDTQSRTILRNCREAMAPGGRVLVIDAVIPQDNAPHQGKTLDLLMMASLVGRERTEREFKDLFAEAGLHLSRIIPTGTVLSIVEAVAATDA
ncbi:acetylserotonin O-methyltransferase [Streptomyces sp. UNOB3_S3]|uniref:acetylserotonin O-methyltransferase n=1 Tax=Streptomyces sp. UNOB3_S3 TaxID=2871682 RepID=UPI001E35906E|nr:acetylserotonin O-methyltransferase [Streptomyces sp. UNOB3_S3]MCC3774197.1 SAM-dependent methyltransferase [Streptomyces sp. UNOB3_S3]